MNATIVCVGKLKERWQKEACAEYQKRLTRYGSVELIELPDQSEPEKSSEALERQLIDKEGAQIMRRIKPTDWVVALCILGSRMDSPKLSREIDRWQMAGKRIVFVIGGSLGLSDEVQRRADVKLSFSDMTFPHPLMRVILLEQLYRAARISAGERYHK
ncbi:23S rRNA (pseudouridine(1915)-N(3))-methyltransferase RlmH [Eubacteriales bacterium OttesenSCG-928-N13]|nr:23S rRNA (pseudouridine(1915)-N(3))-methyltransferase RlmH [Eubacteriales bacterium OttesenSCG-928-N13]